MTLEREKLTRERLEAALASAGIKTSPPNRAAILETALWLDTGLDRLVHAGLEKPDGQ